MLCELRKSRMLVAPVAMAVAGPALAGGLADIPPAPVAAAPVARQDAGWEGAYGGLSFGAIRSDGGAERGAIAGAVIELDVENGLFPDAIDETEIDAIGGVALGYNIQRGAFVGGIEADLSLSGQEAAPEFSRVDPGPLFPGVITDTRFETEISSLATVRLRGGYALGPTLLYATAGLAAGRVENSFVLSLPNFPGAPGGYTSPDWSEDETRLGYAIGAGIERRIGARTRLKAEAVYVDLEDATVEGRDPDDFPGQAIDYKFDNDALLLRLGVNIAF